MNWVDYTILAVIAISVLISLVRGFVREILSIVVWIGAFWAAIRFAMPLSAYLESYISTPVIRIGAAFVGVFVAILLIGAVVNHVAGQLVGRTGLTGTDRVLGMVFGGARGVLIVAAVVLLLGLTTLPREPWWGDSVLLGQIQPLVCRAGVDEWLGDIRFYTPLGDAAAEDTEAAAGHWREFCENGG